MVRMPELPNEPATPPSNGETDSALEPCPGFERTKRVSCFGGNCFPARYTALSLPPECLSIELTGANINKTPFHNLSAEVTDHKHAVIHRANCSVLRGTAGIDLSQCSFESEVPYRWWFLAEPPEELDPLAPSSGLFWLLSTEETQRLQSALELLNSKADPQFLEYARALLLANATQLSH
jgi:hypothetical protein